MPMALLGMVWLALVIVELLRGESGLIKFFGTAIWIVFIAEFLLRFTLAPERLVFVRRNWITVVALVVPALRVFAGIKLLRAIRAVRGLRLVRIIGAANRGMNALRSKMRRRGLGYALVLTVGVVLLGLRECWHSNPPRPQRPASQISPMLSGGPRCSLPPWGRILATHPGRSSSTRRL